VKIEGDLYFQMVDFFNFYGASDSMITSIENQVSSIDFDTISDNEKKAYELIKYAIDQDLLTKPYVRIKTTNGENIMLYMESKNYQQFDSLRCFKLRQEGMKIHIIAETKDISYQDIKAYKLHKLIVYKKIQGETICRK
jgi:hypothetical protein